MLINNIIKNSNYGKRLKIQSLLAHMVLLHKCGRMGARGQLGWQPLG
jgi:hypothetical protein